MATECTSILGYAAQKGQNEVNNNEKTKKKKKKKKWS